MRTKSTTYGDLTMPQTLMLTLGRKGGTVPFRDEADVAAAWAANRDDMIARTPLGRRPSAFWILDTGDPTLDTDEDEDRRFAWLLGHPDQLRLGEEREIRREIRREIEWLDQPEGHGFPPPTSAEIAADKATAKRFRAVAP